LIGGLALVLVLLVGVGAMYALNIGPFAKPTPTAISRPTGAPTAVPTATPTAAPSATPSPTASPTPVASPTGGAGPSLPPTASPTAAPTASATPSAGPSPSGDIAAELLSHVPPAIQGSCFTTPGGAPILALATCSMDDGAIELTYFQYDGQESMFLAYEGFRFVSEIEPDTGDCSDPSTWPTENDYTIGGQPVGRWLCTEALGQTTIYWTDDRLNILSQATHTTADYARLLDFWVNESGPNL
jgi:hypothetical protein